MAEGIAFDLVKGVLGQLGSALWDEIGLLQSFKDDVRDLERQLLKIQAVLRDAEERSDVEEESHALRIWLSELRGAAYDIDDLLDEIRTQAVLRKQQYPEVQVTCLPDSLRSLTSLQWLRIDGWEDLERIEDWLGELTDLQSLEISGCSSLRYLPAHKMTTLEMLIIWHCPLLFNEAGQFVDTSVDHIKNVIVDLREYKYNKKMRIWRLEDSTSYEEESLSDEEVSSPKEEKKSWMSCWSKSNLLRSRT